MRPEGACPAHCCEMFWINSSKKKRGYTPDDMRQALRNNHRSRAQAETEKIARMVLALGYRRKPHDGKLTFMWTCNHFDTETRLCKIYEDRPKMCRDHPGKSECKYGECTMGHNK